MIAQILGLLLTAVAGACIMSIFPSKVSELTGFQQTTIIVLAASLVAQFLGLGSRAAP